jgi:hypothetical protein
MENSLVKSATVSGTPTATMTGEARPSRAAWPTWIGVALVFVLLGISGGIRHWRDRQFRSLTEESKKPPFSLKELPPVLGSWHAVEGSDATLDPQIARIAGSSEHLIRNYVDEKTGETATVMVLYGLAQIVFAHTPEVCFPAAGFSPIAMPREVEIPIPGSSASAKFRTNIYRKNLVGTGIYEEVYHSFRNDGKWRSDVEKQWKSFRYHPGMFKVQVQRRVLAIQTKDSPVEGLLATIVENIEHRLAQAHAGRR